MRETILALLALSIVTTMSLGIMSASLQNKLKQIDQEIEVYGSAVAANVMDYVGSRSFDSRTTPQQWSLGANPDSTQFSQVSTFGHTPDCNIFEPFNDTVICDDIDDLHMAANDWQPYQYVVEVVNGDTLSIPFEVNVQVAYVNIAYPDSTLPTSLKTEIKRVTVRVQSVMHRLDNMAGGLQTIERMFAYDSEAARNQFLNSVNVCYQGNTTLINRSLMPIYQNLGGTAGTCS